MRFQDRTVIVTGGAKGIGAGCAKVFANEGGHVAILDRDVESGTSLAEELTKSGPGDAWFQQCDVADMAALEHAVNAAADHFGHVDCLINNAGVHPPAMTIDQTSIEDLEQVLRINFVSTFAAAKFAVPHLRKTAGTIINLSSMTAVLGQEHSTAYAASKGAQLSFTKSLAIELAADGIRVNAILPSNIDTPLMRDWAATLPDPASALRRVSSLQVFNRMGTPEEIGRIALFLAVDDSSFLTGQGIEADGGAALDY